MTLTETRSWQDYALDHIHELYHNTVVDKFKTQESVLNFMLDAITSVSQSYLASYAKGIEDTYTDSLNYNGELIWDQLSQASICLLGYYAMIPMPTSICNLLASKQKDYGPKNIAKFGTIGILIRMNDKVERLSNILKNAHYDYSKVQTSVNEPIYETIIDIVGYCIIAKMWLSEVPDSQAELTRQFLVPLS